MKKRKINLIIAVTSLALAGIVVTQLFWVKSAVDLKNEQFTHRVELGLKSVLNRLAQADKEAKYNSPTGGMVCGMADTNLIGNFSPQLLDSLVRDEFSHLTVNTDYVYGIYSKHQGQLIFASSSSNHKELLASPLFISLSCIYRPECYVLGIHFPNKDALVTRSIMKWLVLSLLFMIVVMAGFFLSVVSLLKQKKLSEMKADFVNNMTHEFRTPISTISLAGEMLMKPPITSSPAKIHRYGSIILNEINRLKNQVEQVLQVAVLDKGEYSLKKREVDVHRVLEGILKSFSIVVKKREGYIISRMEAENPVIYADKDHLTNIIYNLFDNAEKYAPVSPVITVATKNTKSGIIISVEDNGIGISQEAQKNIFKKLYRVPTGNIHNVKGFGLGLFYTSTMVEAHQGTISLTSESGKGSRFEICLPFGEKTRNTEEYEG